MKINQVEELVGITKKNIRFYEEQGLITPNRNADNGYRDYTLKDVEHLNKIKLLRRLGVPIEQIRNLQEGKLSFDDCMEKHKQHLSHEQHELELTKEICQKLSDEVDDLDAVDPEKYFDEMRRLEEGGIRFMDVNKTDIKKRGAVPAIVIATITVMVMLAVIAAVIWGFVVENMPLWILVLFIVAPAIVIIGVIVAVQQRIREIEGGEAYEASKY